VFTRNEFDSASFTRLSDLVQRMVDLSEGNRKIPKNFFDEVGRTETHGGNTAVPPRHNFWLPWLRNLKSTCYMNSSRRSSRTSARQRSKECDTSEFARL
jgi:hypothetical protein